MANYADSTRTPRTLTEREQKLLLKVTGEHRPGYRDHVLYAMALGTGLREHELIALLVGDVFRDGKPKRRLLLSVFKGAERTGGMQEVLLSESLRGKLRRFWAWKARERESLEADAPLFVSRLGRRLSLRQVSSYGFTVWQDRAGFERRVTFHMLRHSAVTNLYTLTKDIRLTQRFARHRSLVTTMVYTHPSEDDLVRAVEGLRC